MTYTIILGRKMITSEFGALVKDTIKENYIVIIV